VILTAVKKAEDSNALILRFYEWAGKDGIVEVHLPKGATAATLANLMERLKAHHCRSRMGTKSRSRFITLRL